jgi:hypothetical protein
MAMSLFDVLERKRVQSIKPGNEEIELPRTLGRGEDPMQNNQALAKNL